MPVLLTSCAVPCWWISLPGSLDSISLTADRRSTWLVSFLLPQSEGILLPLLNRMAQVNSDQSSTPLGSFFPTLLSKRLSLSFLLPPKLLPGVWSASLRYLQNAK